MKDIVLTISLLLVIGLLVLALSLAQRADKAGKNLEEERYSRMVAEETLQRYSGKLSALQEALQEDHDKMAKIEDVLDQEKGVNADLKKQYDQLSQAKADLEAKLEMTLQEKTKAQAVLRAQPAAVGK